MYPFLEKRSCSRVYAKPAPKASWVILNAVKDLLSSAAQQSRFNVRRLSSTLSGAIFPLAS